MRVAVSGTHRTGKTTLVEALSSVLPAYEVVDEPYRLLEDEGYEFADPPSVEDYERQLRTSIEVIERASADTLFDRCPLDFVAYLQAVDEDFDVTELLDDMRESIERIDLIVVVAIESRISVPSHEDRRLRARVDERLRSIVLDDLYGFSVETLDVSGATNERVRQVLRAMRVA